MDPEQADHHWDRSQAWILDLGSATQRQTRGHLPRRTNPIEETNPSQTTRWQLRRGHKRGVPADTNEGCKAGQILAAMRETKRGNTSTAS